MLLCCFEVDLDFMGGAEIWRVRSVVTLMVVCKEQNGWLQICSPKKKKKKKLHGQRISIWGMEFWLWIRSSEQDNIIPYCATSRLHDNTNTWILRFCTGLAAGCGNFFAWGGSVLTPLFSSLSKVLQIHTQWKLFDKKKDLLFILYGLHLQRIETYFLIFKTMKERNKAFFPKWLLIVMGCEMKCQFNAIVKMPYLYRLYHVLEFDIYESK